MIGSGKAFAGSTGTCVVKGFRSGGIPCEISISISAGASRSSTPSLLVEEDGQAVAKLPEGLCCNKVSIMCTTLLAEGGSGTPADAIFDRKPRSMSIARMCEMPPSTVPSWLSKRGFEDEATGILAAGRLLAAPHGPAAILNCPIRRQSLSS